VTTLTIISWESFSLFMTNRLNFINVFHINHKSLPAGLTCLNDVAAGVPHADLSSFTSCHPLSASSRLMNPGEPFTTVQINKDKE